MQKGKCSLSREPGTVTGDLFKVWKIEYSFACFSCCQEFGLSHSLFPLNSISFSPLPNPLQIYAGVCLSCASSALRILIWWLVIRPYMTSTIDRKFSNQFRAKSKTTNQPHTVEFPIHTYKPSHRCLEPLRDGRTHTILILLFHSAPRW